eukprot:SAG22_NODE_3139_length_1908_cov_1.787175_2_plen_46_part_01
MPTALRAPVACQARSRLLAAYAPLRSDPFKCQSQTQTLLSLGTTKA